MTKQQNKKTMETTININDIETICIKDEKVAFKGYKVQKEMTFLKQVFTDYKNGEYIKASYFVFDEPTKKAIQLGWNGCLLKLNERKDIATGKTYYTKEYMYFSFGNFGDKLWSYDGYLNLGSTHTYYSKYWTEENEG